MDLGKQLDIFQWIYGIDVDLRVDKNTPDNSFKGRYKIEHCKSLLLFYLFSKLLLYLKDKMIIILIAIKMET